MSQTNHLNVFAGESSLRDYYDPDKQPPLPLVEVPRKLNPYYDDGVRIYAKMMSALPANNVKALPALNMLQSSQVTPKTKTIVEYSSGSTVISLSIIARVLHNLDDTRAFLSNKTAWAKLQMMRFFGLDITLFGGPSQPEPDDVRGGIFRAERQAQGNEEVVNLNQYTNDLNWGAHVRWTGPQLLKQLPQMNVFCAGMGTAGTMTGIGTYLKQEKPSIVRVGVCTKAGERVPGPRSHALLAPVKFPWKEAIDSVQEVGGEDSYRLSMMLSREGLICGPSSGFNLQGLYDFLAEKKKQGSLDDLRGEDGLIHSVFICCDLPYQYLDDYFTKLGPEYFHELKNKNLLDVDLYRYDEAWEVDAATLDLHSGLSILDLRTFLDFNKCHLPTATNLPLEIVDSATPSPFFDSETLKKVWTELELVVDKRLASFSDKNLLIVCYDGDVSRVATSVLRQKGVNASSVKHGMRGLEARLYAAGNDVLVASPIVHFPGYGSQPSVKFEPLVSVAAL
ncbi:Cysteine synthase [Lachnellula suecica]|uniref:Cysteine synthase n=1 Tax=Lachnellula suecica TaxID=602035 RepID=A0A8T9BZD8_9HELO|nr:Cysteine synthase [Lachnellula suecica]